MGANRSMVRRSIARVLGLLLTGALAIEELRPAGAIARKRAPFCGANWTWSAPTCAHASELLLDDPFWSGREMRAALDVRGPRMEALANSPYRVRWALCQVCVFWARLERRLVGSSGRKRPKISGGIFLCVPIALPRLSTCVCKAPFFICAEVGAGCSLRCSFSRSPLSVRIGTRRLTS
jgi:hypothetical protein